MVLHFDRQYVHVQQPLHLRRITLAFGLLVLLSCGIAVVGLLSIRSVAGSSDEIVERRLPMMMKSNA